MVQMEIFKAPKMGFERKKLIQDWGNTRITATIGGKTCNFRSKLEYRYAQYLQFLKDAGQIKDWNFEQTKFIFPDETRGAKEYLVDFDILNLDGTFEYHETKGFLTGKDITKFSRVAKYRPEAKIILVMASPDKKRVNRYQSALKYIDRIRYIADDFRKLGIK